MRASELLAGRSADAMRNAPYTQIFPEGIDYYTAAPLDQEVTRYGQLVYRLKQFDHHHPSSQRDHHIHHTLPC